MSWLKVTGPTLLADWILRIPMGRPALGIVGAVLGVLQIALGVQLIIAGLRLLAILPVAANP